MHRNKRLLSDNLARKTKPESKRFTIWDTQQTGFGLRIAVSGKSSWIAKYRVGQGRGGKQALVTLGSPPALSADDARAKAGQLIVAGRQNIDLKDQWEAEGKQREKDRKEQILEGYGEASAQNPAYIKNAWQAAINLSTDNSPRYTRNQMRLLKHITERFGSTLKTKDLTTDDITQIKRELSATPSEFNRFRAVLYTVLENEIYEQRLDRNHLKRIPPNPIKFRQTILTDKGIKQFKEFFFEASTFDENEQNYARFVACLLLTGQRPTMMRTLRVKDDDVSNYVNWQQGSMIFRTHKTSKIIPEKEVAIPLSNNALSIMQEASLHGPKNTFVFSSPDQRAHFRDLAISEKRAQSFFRKHAEQFEKEGHEGLVLYSLRHTFGSTMANSNIPIIQVSKMMLHTSIQTTQKYLKTTWKNRLEAAERIDEVF
nr:integrase family protein [uncultured Shimia sp.]